MKRYEDIEKAVKDLAQKGPEQVESIRPNGRARGLEVTDKKEYYKRTGPDYYLFAEGNGTEYAFVVFEDSDSLVLYTSSNYQLKEQINGYKLKTDRKSSERVRKVDIVFADSCERCGNEKLRRSDSSDWYCPICD